MPFPYLTNKPASRDQECPHAVARVKRYRANLIAALTVAVLGVFAGMTPRGPYEGLVTLRNRVAQLQALREQHHCLEQALIQKKLRIEALETGTQLDIEIRRYGFTLPGETEYRVPEPESPATGPESRSALATAGGESPCAMQ